MKRRYNRLLSLFAIIGLLSSLLFVPGTAEAAGVAVAVTTPATAEFAATTSTDVTFRYLPSTTEFANTDVITVTITPVVDSAVSDCSSATDDLDGDTTTDGAFGSFTTSGAAYTLTAATTTATTTYATMCLNFANDTVAGIYSIAIVDNNDDDFGAALIYVGDENDVTITAEVQPTLSFAIRNTSDTGDTNTCALGVLYTTAVSDCSYRLKVSTNSQSGYDVDFKTDGDLTRDGSPGDDPDADDIDRITEDGTITAGTEGYGIELVGGASSEGGVSITESDPYDDDDTPLPTAGVLDEIYTSDGPNNPSGTDTTNTALVTHQAAIDTGTRTGNYIQIVAYYVSATF